MIKKYWYFFLAGLVLFIALFYRRDVMYNLFMKFKKLSEEAEKDIMKVKKLGEIKEKEVREEYERRIRRIDEEIEEEFEKAKKEGTLDALAERLFGSRSS